MQQIKLPDSVISELMEIPESGMGYHKVRVYLTNGEEVSDAVVFNSEILQLNISREIDSSEIHKVEVI